MCPRSQTRPRLLHACSLSARPAPSTLPPITLLSPLPLARSLSPVPLAVRTRTRGSPMPPPPLPRRHTQPNGRALAILARRHLEKPSMNVVASSPSMSYPHRHHRRCCCRTRAVVALTERMSPRDPSTPPSREAKPEHRCILSLPTASSPSLKTGR